MTIHLRTRAKIGNIYLNKNSHIKYQIIKTKRVTNNEGTHNVYIIQYLDMQGELKTKEVRSNFFHDLYFQYNEELK